MVISQPCSSNQCIMKKDKINLVKNGWDVSLGSKCNNKVGEIGIFFSNQKEVGSFDLYI